MRFDTSIESNYATASDILNGSSEYELTQIFKKFGDEPFAAVLADKVIKAREGTILATNDDFKNAIFSAFPNSGVEARNQSTKRAFQAVRMAVNQELTNLTTFLEGCPANFLNTKVSRRKSSKKMEASQSLLMIITFNSIEEKTTLQAMARWKKAKLGDLATKNVIKPTE